MGIYETGHVHSVEMAHHFPIILLLVVLCRILRALEEKEPE